MKISRTTSRIRRRRRIRAKITGTAVCPRLTVNKSLRHLRAQLVDDATGKTLTALSTLDLKKTANLAGAQELGLTLAKKAVELGIQKVVFDRGGYQYHGQIKAVAEGAREGGLIF